MADGGAGSVIRASPPVCIQIKPLSIPASCPRNVNLNLVGPERQQTMCELNDVATKVHHRAARRTAGSGVVANLSLLAPRELHGIVLNCHAEDVQIAYEGVWKFFECRCETMGCNPHHAGTNFESYGALL